MAVYASCSGMVGSVCSTNSPEAIASLWMQLEALCFTEHPFVDVLVCDSLAFKVYSLDPLG